MRSPTPWIAALLVSVLANGALIGFVLHKNADGPSWRVAHEDGPRPGPPRSGPMSGFDVRGFLAALPEAEREIAERRLHQNMETMRGLGRQAYEAHQQADAVLAAEPFDAVAAQAALGRVREIRLGFETQMEASLIEVIADLDPEVRAAALEAGRVESYRGRRGPDSRRRHDGARHERPDGPEGPERR
ncbi:periplasmic heavy metal sensor [uncultured Maricaulis sp.]|uniref:periplasmic heavy metal sensor n=1 Tax=uncultured Maricaulis sp. TaxID=174710 RepID=UPI0030D86BAE|tara:strand:- start:26001 stop:26564 length:564 start_codon:yes stop_codon:yes gene_type:complete